MGGPDLIGELLTRRIVTIGGYLNEADLADALPIGHLRNLDFHPALRSATLLDQKRTRALLYVAKAAGSWGATFSKSTGLAG